VFGRGLELNAGPYVDLKGRFALSGRNLAVPELVWRTPGGDLTARGDVTFTGQGPPDFDLRLRGEEVSLGFLAGWAPGTEIEGSRLGADVSLVRKDGVFAPGGTLRLGASRLKGTPARLDLRDISLLFEAGRDRLEIVEGAAKTQKGRVTFSGHVGVDGPDVTVHAEGLAFRAPGEVEGAVSGTLTLEGAWPAPKATGDLRVDRADYRPAKKEKKEKEEKGAEGASAADEAPSPPGPLAADVRVRFDRDVWYKDGSNYVELKGDLRLRKERWEPLRLIGKIETLRGRYSLYGRTFDVQKGRATFHGELPVDPALDVRAMYLEENSGTKVFIDVGGTAKEPKIELSSLPPMEEQDILAVLAFGRPLDGAEGPGGSAAAQSLVANYLLQKTRDIPLVRQLDLDILQVERSPAGDTSLTVGRYVSPDLFVSYDQTVGDDGQRRLNAEYTLTDHWSLFGRRSKGNHYVIDLLFKFGVR
jgi:translocation and assembly module TamB